LHELGALKWLKQRVSFAIQQPRWKVVEVLNEAHPEMTEIFRK